MHRFRVTSSPAIAITSSLTPLRGGTDESILAADLKAVLEANKVPKAEVDEIMKIAASTAPDIVEKK
jgi:hypothetical protein